MSGAIFISDDLVLSILLFAISHLQGVPKNVLSIDVFDNLGPIWVHLDTFGPFQTKINLLRHKDKERFGRGAFEQKIIFCLKWSKRVQTGPKGSQMVKNILVDPFGAVWTPLDHFEMLTSVSFCLSYWTPCMIKGQGVRSCEKENMSKPLKITKINQ